MAQLTHVTSLESPSSFLPAQINPQSHKKIIYSIKKMRRSTINHNPDQKSALLFTPYQAQPNYECDTLQASLPLKESPPRRQKGLFDNIAINKSIRQKSL